MTTLTIKDLSVTAELDHKEMAAVRGGTGQGMYQYSAPWGGKPYGDFGDYSKSSSFNFDATQALGQSQNTLVNNGNNAAFVDNITANVHPTQTGTNNINFGH